MKPLVIYHANCADGFGAAFAAWLKLGDEAEYLPMQYGKDTDNWYYHTFAQDEVVSTLDNREIYILDFSLPKNMMDYLFAHAKRVIWLDHHKTAFELWCDGFEKGDRFEAGPTPQGSHIILDDNKSGAMLAWEYFHPGTEVPRLIRHIDDYDRWQFKIEGTKEFNKALWSYAPWSFALWQGFVFPQKHPLSRAAAEQLMEAELDLLAGYYAEGRAILRAHEQNVQAVVKGSARECEIEHKRYSHEDELPICTKFPGLAANCPPHLTSDVGHELANQSGTFGLCWTLKKEGMVAQCSLRSNGEYDVSAIAKALGGGGHRNAAGFEVPIEVLLEWLK